MQYMSLVSVALGVALLLILYIKFKVHSILCLLFAAIFVGILEKEPLDKLVLSIQNGLGSTLGNLALVNIFGVAIGQLMVECGAAQRIAGTLLKVFGTKGIKIAIIITGFVFGIAMFFEVAFITLAPLIISIAVEAGLPIISLGMTMIASATAAHSLFPPQPGATAIANSLAVPLGDMYIYGLIVAIPTILISGLILPKFVNVKIGVPKSLESSSHCRSRWGVQTGNIRYWRC